MQIAYAIICAVVVVVMAIFLPLAAGHFSLARRQIEQAQADAIRHRRNLPQRKRRAKEELVRSDTGSD